jgi:hypothetical protein
LPERSQNAIGILLQRSLEVEFLLGKPQRVGRAAGLCSGLAVVAGNRMVATPGPARLVHANPGGVACRGVVSLVFAGKNIFPRWAFFRHVRAAIFLYIPWN